MFWHKCSKNAELVLRGIAKLAEKRAESLKALFKREHSL